MSRRRRKKQGEVIVGSVLIAIAACIVVAGGVGYYVFASTRITTDESFCPDGQEPPSITAVVVDTTDQFTPIQRLAIQQELVDLRDRVDRYGAIEVYEVAPIEDEPLESLIRVCNPGRGRDVSQVTASPQLVEKHWREQYEEPINALVERLIANDQGADSSPIIEAIQSVSLTSFGGRAKDSVAKRLILVSDLLQHSREFSHYRRDDAETFRASQSYRRLLGDLRDVEVEILLVDRGMAVQNNALVGFWKTLIDQQGGSVARIRKISG